ncbi:ABC transporter ATP-binding protein [Candidatus Gottesmanbacteria bacterium]|nr:ABC transporter ATP-binding protein [Candidatus Gottesmanbacteria bacterium]
MADTVLELIRLTKMFKGFTAVDNVSFTVKKGEIVGLLGPNGAGKTTTIAMIMGIITPTTGEIRVFGKEFSRHRQDVLTKMNYSSAYSKLPWRLTVWESLYVFSQLYGVSNPRERIEELIKAFEVEEFKDRLLGDLSAGNNTRVNLCKAFINRPELVLLDEPTASLDPDIADRVRFFIHESRERFNTTVLITSHNMAEIEELCDRVVFISKGKIIAQDTPEGLAKKISKTRVRLMMRDGQKRTVAYCNTAKFPIRVSDRYVEIDVDEQQVASLLTELAEIGVTYSEISIDKPTLEDFFIGEVRDAK